MIPVMHLLRVSRAAHCLAESVADANVALKAAWHPRIGTERALDTERTAAKEARMKAICICCGRGEGGEEGSEGRSHLD